MAKYCPQCGAELDAAAQTCPNCGHTMEPPSPKEGSQLAQTGGSLPQQAAWDGQPNRYTPPQDSWNPACQQPTMKWFKFVIWVQLFLGALSNLGTGISLLTGSIYEGYAEDVYAAFGLMRPLDILNGLLCIALAVAAIYVRFQLSGYKQKAPTLYLYYLLAGIAVSLFYLLASSLIVGTFMGDYSTIVSLVTNIVMYVLNRIYFEKRSFLFVH